MIPFLEILLALPFVLALVVALARGLPRGATAWLAGLAPLLGLVLLAWMTPSVLNGWDLRADHAWIPQIGLSFTLRLDGLAWMLAGLGLGIGGAGGGLMMWNRPATTAIGVEMPNSSVISPRCEMVE